MKRLRVVLDTNVLISGTLWSGIPSDILEKCRLRCIDLIISTEILSELEETLRYEKKFKQTEESIKKNINEIAGISMIVEPKERLFVIEKDVDDNVVLECALAGDSDYIITGDKHLLELKEYGKIKVVTPREFIEILYELG